MSSRDQQGKSEIANPDHSQMVEDAGFFREILHELIEMGTGLARLVHAEAKSNPQAAASLAIAFERVARAIRRTILLAQRVAENARATQVAENARATQVAENARATQQGAQTTTPARIAARKRIIRDVEDAIQRTAAETDAATLQSELHDRLDAPDLLDEIDTRPIAAIVADICRDLGLATPPGTRPWKRRTPQDIADLCTKAARPFTLVQTPNPPPPNADNGGRESKAPPAAQITNPNPPKD